MGKLKLNNIVFGTFLILLIIPKTRTFIQVNMHKMLAKISSTKTIDANEQKTITEYTGKLNAINTSENIDFSDLKGKVVFINFWATWCPPCIAEMQSLQDLYNKYEDEVVFLFVTNDSAVKTNAFLQKHNYTLPSYTIKTALPNAFEHSTIPTTYIVNKKGNIVVEKKGAVNWNSEQVYETIDLLLKE